MDVEKVGSDIGFFRNRDVEMDDDYVSDGGEVEREEVERDDDEGFVFLVSGLVFLDGFNLVFFVGFLFFIESDGFRFFNDYGLVFLELEGFVLFIGSVEGFIFLIGSGSFFRFDEEGFLFLFLFLVDGLVLFED